MPRVSTRQLSVVARGCVAVALIGTLALVSSAGVSTIGPPAASATSAASSSAPDATGTPAASIVTTIGFSVRRRPIFVEQFGSGSRHVLIVGGIHGNEAGGPVAKAFSAYLRAHPSAIPTSTQLDVVSNANPDGRAAKRRTNAHHVDLNRNFPSSNWSRARAGATSHGVSPGSEPETQVMARLLAERGYVRVISLHSAGGIVDYRGPGARTLARRIAKVAHIKVHRLPSYAGSMGSYVPEKYRIPIITWELSSRALTRHVRSGLLSALR